MTVIDSYPPVLSTGFYQIDRLPWKPHPMDPKGFSVVFAESGQSFYSMAFNKYTEGFYRFYRTGPKGDEHYFHGTPEETDKFLAMFPDGSLVFGDDAYAERRSWRVAA